MLLFGIQCHKLNFYKVSFGSKRVRSFIDRQLKGYKKISCAIERMKIDIKLKLGKMWQN